MKIAMTILRVSAADQLRGYGPDAQWFEDVLPAADLLGLEVSEVNKRVIQERATTWDRERFEKAVREALTLFSEGTIQALIFPRVDRETRFLWGSFPLLAEVIQRGLPVYFARERLLLDPGDPDSLERYLNKAQQAQAYVQTLRINTMAGKKRRVLQDHKLPNGQVRWPFDYNPGTGRASANPERSAWVRKWAEWLLEEGVSIGAVCERMEKAGIPAPKGGPKWSRSTVTRILADPELIGQFYAWKGSARLDVATSDEATPQKHQLVYRADDQAILTEEQFYAVQERLRSNRANSARSTKLDYPPLRGLVFCSCGRRMSGTPIHGYPYYRCNFCRRPLVNARNLWEKIQTTIKSALLEPERLVPVIRTQLESGVTAAELERQISEYRTKLSGWEEAEDRAVKLHLVLTDYPVEKLKARMDEILAAKLETERELNQLQAKWDNVRRAKMDEEGVQRFCDLAAKNIDNLAQSQWRLILEKLQVRVQFKQSGAIGLQMAIRPVEPDLVLQQS